MKSIIFYSVIYTALDPYSGNRIGTTVYKRFEDEKDALKTASNMNDLYRRNYELKKSSFPCWIEVDGPTKYSPNAPAPFKVKAEVLSLN